MLSLFVIGIVGVAWVLVFHVTDTDYTPEEEIPGSKDAESDLKEEGA